MLPQIQDDDIDNFMKTRKVTAPKPVAAPQSSPADDDVDAFMSARASTPTTKREQTLGRVKALQDELTQTTPQPTPNQTPFADTAKPMIWEAPEMDENGMPSGRGAVITKPEGAAPRAPRAPKPREREAARLIRDIEGRRDRATELFRLADAAERDLTGIDTGRSKTNAQTLRQQAEAELYKANLFADGASARYADLIETGFGADADPTSKRKWAYAKAKTPELRELIDRGDLETGTFRRRLETENRKITPEQQARYGRQRKVEASRAAYDELSPVARMAARAFAKYGDASDADMAEAMPVSQIESTLGQVAQGAITTAARIPEGLQRIDPFGWNAQMREEQRRRGFTPIPGKQITQAGDDLANVVAPIDKADEGFFTAKLPRGLGSSAPFLVSGALGGGMPAAAILGSAINAQQVGEELDRKGITDEATRQKATAVAGLIGSLEALGIEGRLNKVFGGRAGLTKRLLGAGSEGVQEWTTEQLNDVNAALIAAYDPGRDLSPVEREKLEAFALGTLTGGLFEAGGKAAEVVRGESPSQIRSNLDARTARNFATAIGRTPAPPGILPTVSADTQTTVTRIDPSIVRGIPRQVPAPPGATPAAIAPEVPSLVTASPAAPAPVSSPVSPTLAQPIAPLFPQAQTPPTARQNLEHLSPEERRQALIEGVRATKQGRAAASLEQQLNTEFTEGAGLVNSAAQSWDADRPTAELLATTGTQRLKIALQNLQKSEAYQMESGAVASGAGQPGPYIAAAQSIQQQLDQADNLFRLDAERERQQAELLREQGKQQKKVEKEAAKQSKFAEREQLKLDRQLQVEQQREQAQVKRDEAAAKRMETARAAQEARRAQLEQQREQSRNEKTRKIADAELQRMQLHDAALEAADTAGQRHQEYLNQGMIAEAINELTVQQKQLQDAVRQLPRTPQAQTIKADLNRYQGQIGNRIGDLRKQMRGQQVPVTQPIPPLFQPSAAQNPAGGVPELPSFYEPGAVFDREVGELGDTDIETTPLLTTIRRLGGIRADGISDGELERLGVRESGTTGLVNNRGGLAPDRMREALAEEGLLPSDSTVDDLFQAIEGEMRGGRRGQGKETIADFYDRWEAEQADRETERRGDGETREAAGSAIRNPQSAIEVLADEEADDMAALQRSIARSQADSPRPYNERTRPGEPGSGGISFSDYAYLESRNVEPERALYDNDPTSETFKDAVEWITEDAAKAGIGQRHVDAMVAYALNWHGEKAFWESQGLSMDTVQQAVESVDEKRAEVLADARRLPPLERTEIEREVAALDALFDDPDAVNLLERAAQGEDNAADEFNQVADEYGISAETAGELIRTRRPVRRANPAPKNAAPARPGSDSPKGQTDAGRESARSTRKPTQQELQLLAIRPTDVFDKDFDRYMTAVEDLYARTMRGEVDIDPLTIYDPAKWVGVSSKDIDALRASGENAGILARIHGNRHRRVEENRLPARENVEIINKYKDADLTALAEPGREGRKSRLDQIIQATSVTLEKNPSGVSPAWMQEVRQLRERAIAARDKHQAQKADSPPAPARPAESKSATVKMMLTRDDRQQLADLGYTRADIDAMSPQEGADIIASGQTKTRTVTHPDPTIDGKPILAETGDGRVIVPNPENKSGISVVKDRSGEVESPSQPASKRGRLALAVADHLTAGNKFTNIVEARKFIAQQTGEQIKPGSLDAKQVDEAIEAGAVIAARRIVAEGKSPQQTFRALLRLQDRLPTLSARTSTSVLQQAYSTPLPLAYVASQLAGIDNQTTVYEPSAGHSALLITASPKNIVANELNEERAAALRDILPGAEITEHDAADWKPARSVDRVITNPPFGAVKDDSGKNRRFQIDGKYETSEIDHAIAFEALKAMKDDGKAVLIVAGLRSDVKAARSAAYNTGAKRNFYFTLYNQYNVVDHFTVNGDLYNKQGAGWPVDVIVIDGRGKSQRDLPAVAVPQILNTWEAVGAKLDATSTRRPTQESRAADDVRLGERGLPGGQRDSRSGERAADDERVPGVPARSSERNARPGVAADMGAPVADRPTGSRRTVEPASESAQPGRSPERSSVQQPSPARTPEQSGSVSGARDRQQGQPAREAVSEGNQPGTVGERADRGAGRASDVGSVFDEEFAKLFGEDAIPQTQPTEPRPPRTTKEAAKSAAKESKDTLKEIAKGLSELFGGPKLSSGLTFDEKTYAAAKPHFEAAMQHFQQATRDVREVMANLLKELNQRFGFQPDVLQKMKPYIVRFVEEQQTGQLNQPSKSGFAQAETVATKPATATNQTAEADSDTHRVYKPASGSYSVGTLVPVNMANAVENSLARLQEEVGDLDTYVADRLGYKPDELSEYFSGEQVDAVALAVRNIEKGGGLILGDQCVAAGTRIYNPISNTHTPIEVLAERGESITVLALTPSGLKPAIASAPFKKGVADLYRVVLDDGRQITVTAAHRFLTPEGWSSVGAGLRAGHFLASAEGRPACNLGFFPLTPDEDVPHLTQTPEDSLASCSRYRRQCDEQLQSEAGISQVFPQRRGDARGHIRLLSRRDDSGVLAGCSHPHRSFDRLSRNNSFPSASRVPSLTLAQESASVGRLSPQKFENAPRSGRLSSQPHQEHVLTLQDQSDLSAFDWFQSASVAECHVSEERSRFEKNSRRTDLQCKDYARPQDKHHRLPVLAEHQTVQNAFSFGDYTGWRRIVSIDFIGCNEFFDLWVPDHENYVAEGIIHHNTGIGKGRVVAGIIRYAIKQKLTPVFVTEKPTLYGDMIRDLADIGSADVKPLVTNAGESVPLDDDALAWYSEAEKAKLEDRPVPAKRGKFLQTKAGKEHNAMLKRFAESGNLGGHHVIFTTYNQMQTVKGKMTDRHDLLSRFANGGIVIFDESHNAGGAGKVETDDKGEVKFDRATFARQLARDAKGLLYSSATFAKRPEVMDLYFRTELGKAVGDLAELSEITSKGGVPMQQVIASMLAESGQYIRRERSFAGVEYAPTPTKVDRKTAESVSRAMREVARFDLVKQEAVKTLAERVKKEAKRITGDGTVGQAGVHSTNFTSLMHNLIDQSLLALKVDQAADMAIAALERGEKPVITVANTMGSFIQRFAEENELRPGSPITLSFNDLLDRYLERSRDVIVGKPYGEKFRHYLSDEELGSEGVEAYKAAKEFLESLNLDIPISPIDWLHKRLRDAGYRTGEITGRGHIVNYTNDGPVYTTRPVSETSTAAKKRTIAAFNDGTMDVVILNQSGSTGISLHASEKFKDQRRRHMIIAQAEKNIDTHMQMLGRVHRTNQVISPRYTQMVADIPAELRPAAVLAKKMASLNANTTASRSSAVTAKDVPDFLNKYGDEVAASLMESNPELHEMLGRPLKDSEKKEGFEREDAMRKVTGRIPLLPISEQESVYEQLIDEYADALQQAEASGENALEAKTLDLQAETTKTQLLVPGSGASLFEQAANLERVKSNRQGKPFKSNEVIEKLQAALGSDARNLVALGRAGAQQVRQMRGDLEAEVAAYKNKVEEEHGGTKRAAIDQLAADKWLNRWNQITGTVYPGAAVQIAGGYGVVLNVERKGKRSNPVALSGWRATVMMADGRRQLQVPFSKIDLGEATEGAGRTTIRPGQDAITYDPEKEDFVTIPILDAFDKGLSATKETRYVVTGNLIAGFSAAPNGQIVNFTDDAGRVKQGILMPVRFDPADVAGKQKEKLKTAEAVLNALTDARGEVTDREGNLTIRRAIGGGGYVVSVPSAKGRGGKYYLNRALLAAAGRDFAKRGGLMEVQVGESSLRRMVDVLLKGEGMPTAVGLQAKMPKIAERRSDAPFTERYTVRDLATNATAEYRPATNRPGTVFLNEWGHALLRDTLVTVYGEKVAGIPGDFTLDTASLRRAADAMRDRADGAFIAIADKLETAADDADVNGRDVALVTRRAGQSLADLKATVRHETIHAAQSAVDTELTGAATMEWLNRQPKARQIKAELERRGYKPSTFGFEAVAFVASGDFGVFGMSLDEATRLMDSYYQATVRKYGASALAKFGAIDPKLQPTLERARRETQPGRTNPENTTQDTGRSDRRAESQTGRNRAGDGGSSSAGQRGTEEVPRVAERRERRFSFGELENEPTGTILASGLGAFQSLRGTPKPKTTPLREIIAEHQPLVVNPYKIQDMAMDEILNASERGIAGTLPGARALYWTNKLKLKKLTDKLADRQANFISKTIEQTNDMIAASEAMRAAEPGSEAYQKAKKSFERARLKLADALAKAGEYTTLPGYAAKTYKTSLLSAPHIHLFNMLEQALKLPLHQAQRAVDLIVPASILNKYGIPYEKAVTDFRDLVPAIEAELRGLGAGAKEIPRDVADMFRYGITRQMQQADDAEQGHAGGTDKFELGHRAKLIPGLDQVLNFIGRSHGAADIAFTNLVNATAISAQANAIARKFGKENSLSKKKMDDMARDLAYRPSALMITLANDAALRFKLDYPTLAYDALQKLRDLPSTALGKATEKGVGKAVDSTWKAAMDFIVPFSKIPLAAVDTYLFRYSPVAFGRVAGRMAMAKGGEHTGRFTGEFAKQRFAEDTAELFRQGVVGSLSWALLGALGSFGYLAFTGGGEDDKDRPNVKNLREALRVPYGPEVRVGDIAFNLNRMGPLGQAAGIATRIAEAQKPRTDPKTGEPEEIGKRIARTATAAKDALIFNNPLGSAAKDLAGDDMHSTSAGQYIAGKLRGFVPGLARDIAKIQSPTKRMPETSSTLGRFKGDLQSGMPVDIGFGSREQMTERVDALGRPIEEPNPFKFWREIPRNPQLEEMERLGVGFSKPRKDKEETATEYNRRIAGYIDPKTGERVPGAADQLQKALRRIADDANWARRSDEAKARIYSTELQPKAIERADKLSEESILAEREIEALRADTFEALRALPAYRQARTKERKAIRKEINDALDDFRATAQGTRRSKSGKVSVVREKAARLPDIDPQSLARWALDQAGK